MIKSIFKFVLVEALYLNNERYWALFIESPNDLMNYCMKMDKSLGEAYFKIKKDKFYRREYGNTNEEHIIDVLFAVNNNNRKTFVDDLNHISSAQKLKWDMILKGKKILINSTLFGFCPYNPKTQKIIQTVKRKVLIFPSNTLSEKDIKVTKWEGGKHWYVKIGQHQMENKFNTYDYALGKKFLKKVIWNENATNL